jgi:hypothetical protein
VDIPSQTAQGQWTLSIHRSFVVRLYAGVDLAHGQIAGRVEHIVSAQGTEFRSADELIRFMSAVLADPARQSG